ncbi:MAG: hypothetical protein ACTHOU_03415, partial [Aureliella sp.]
VTESLLDQGGAVPSEIASSFDAAGYPLSAGVTVSVVTPGEKWEVIDGKNAFVITDEGSLLGVTARGDLAQLEQTIRIEAGATVYHRSLPKEMLNATTDVIITTDGKFVLRADVNFLGGAIKSSAVFYSDLSHVAEGDATLLMYLKSPSPILGPFGSQTIWGGVHFGYVDAQGNPVPVDIDNVDLAQTPLQIVVTGGAALSLGTPGVPASNVQPTDLLTLSVSGSLIMTARPNELTVDAFASLAVSGLIDIPDIATAGLYFVFSETGIWGSAEVGTNLEQLEKAGVFIDATGYLQLNTTDSAKTVYPRQSADIDDRVEQLLKPQSFEIYAAGNMSLEVAGVVLAREAGVFALQISNEGLKVFTAGILTVGPQGLPFSRSFEVFGALFISEDGFATKLSAKAHQSNGLYDADLTFSLIINTTELDQEYVLPTRLVGWLEVNAPALLSNVEPEGAVRVSAGAPRRDGSFGDPSPYFVFTGSGSVTLASVARVDGAVFISVDKDEMTIDLDGKLDFGPLQASAHGLVYVRYDEGVAFQLEVDASLDLGPLSFLASANGHAFMQFSNLDRDFENIPANTPLLIDIAGDMKLLNSFEAHGHFRLEDADDRVKVAIDGKLDVWSGGVTVDVNAVADIYKDNPGLVLYSDASLSAGKFFGAGVDSNPIFQFHVGFHLEFNTRAKSNGVLADQIIVGNELHTVPRESLQVRIDGRVDLFGGLIKLDGQGAIKVQDGLFQVDVSMNATLTPVLELNAHGFFSSDGQFSIDVGGYVNLGVDGFGLFGNVGVTISYLNQPNAYGTLVKTLYVHGHASVALKAFGVTLVGLGLDVQYSSGTGEFGLTVDVEILGAHIRPHFTLGYVKPPPPPQFARIEGGSLVLNVGDDAGRRNIGKGVADESYVISQTGDRINIFAFGLTESYSIHDQFGNTRFSNIVGGDFKSGIDTLEVQSTVTMPVTDVRMGNQVIVRNLGMGP